MRDSYHEAASGLYELARRLDAEGETVGLYGHLWRRAADAVRVLAFEYMLKAVC